MATYDYTLYSEKDIPIDRYRVRVEKTRYANGRISAASRNQAIEKAILSVGMFPRGDYLEIRTQKGALIAKFKNTERPVEPWGRQWTDMLSKGDRLSDSTRNYHIRDGKVYYVMGMGIRANRLNPVKKR